MTALTNAVNSIWSYANAISARSADRGPIWATWKQVRDLIKGGGMLLGPPSQVEQHAVD